MAAGRHHYRRSAGAAATAFLLALVVAGPMDGWVGDGFWQFPLAAALLLPWVKHRPPAAAGLLRYAPVLVPSLLVGAGTGLTQAFPEIAGILRWGAVAALCAGALLWLAVDERVALAVGLVLANSVLIHLVLLGQAGLLGRPAAAYSLAILAFWTALLLIPAVVTARRQARL